LSYPVETDQHGNATPPTTQQSLGGLQSEVVQKPKVVKCLKCGSTTFDLITHIQVRDMLSFDDETGEPFISAKNLNELLDAQSYRPHKDCERIECSECGEPIPKEWFADLPDRIETELME